jgi:hypothetical protein
MVSNFDCLKEALVDHAKTDYRPGVKCQQMAMEAFEQSCSDSNVEEWRSLLPVVVRVSDNFQKDRA